MQMKTFLFIHSLFFSDSSVLCLYLPLGFASELSKQENLKSNSQKKSFVKATENGIFVQVFLAAGVINVWHFG